MNTSNKGWGRVWSFLFIFIVMFMMMFTTGCGPAKVMKVEEIGPNETAWAIPLEQDSLNGQKFNSIGYLNQKMVATKRVWIDMVKRSTGRMWYDYEWIPATRLVKVNRSLVTREWTPSDKNGTSQKDEGITVVTKDNIGLDLGIMITVYVSETDASTYLYYNSDKPLSEVADSNIRGYVSTSLSHRVGSMTLQQFQDNQTNIYNELAREVIEACRTNGIGVQSIGNARGWKFTDERIQAEINNTYIASQKKKTAEQEQQTQMTMNATAVMNQTNANFIKVSAAQAELDSAELVAKSKDSTSFQNQLKIALMDAQAKLAMATNWNGQLPANILPESSPMLMSLGTGGGSHTTNSWPTRQQ